MPQRIYFGHPVNFYNTEKEKELIERIKKAFPGTEIENPNQPHHKKGYQRYKKGAGDGMDYFFKEVLPLCQKGVFMSFEDGNFGAGVFGEAELMKASGKLIHEINLEGIIKNMILDYSRALSVEETRKRVYYKAN